MLGPERSIRGLQYLLYLLNIRPAAQEAYVKVLLTGGLEYHSGFGFRGRHGTYHLSNTTCGLDSLSLCRVAVPM